MEDAGAIPTYKTITAPSNAFAGSPILLRHTNRACFTAAAMNPRNSGCGSNGFDFSSG